MSKRVTMLFEAISVILICILLTALPIAANLLFSLRGDPYSTLFERLNPQFYVRTAGILIISSLLYTPISYGISYFFWQGERREVRFADLLIVLRKPLLFCKAIALRLLIWFVRGMGQVALLLCGLVIETVRYLLILARKGDDVLSLTLSEIVHSRARESREMWFSVVLWGVILLWMIWMGLRFMFCKYALIRFEELSPWESLSIGLLASKGRGFGLIGYWLKYYTYYILLILTFGVLRQRLRAYRNERFSVYAIRLVETARGKYFREKADKNA